MNIVRLPLIQHWKPVPQMLLLLGEITLGFFIGLVFFAVFSPFAWQEFVTGRLLSGVWKNASLFFFYFWLVLVLFLFRFQRQESFRQWGLHWQGYKALTPGVVLGALFLFGLRFSQGLAPLAVRQLSLKEVLVQLAAAVLLAGLEELLFRGLIFQILRPWGQAQALILQALLFSAVHGESWRSPILALNLVLVACLLGQLRIRRGHLGWSIGLHAGWIWAVFCLNLLGAMQVAGQIWNPLQALTTTAVLLLLLRLILNNDARIPSVA